MAAGRGNSSHQEGSINSSARRRCSINLKLHHSYTVAEMCFRISVNIRATMAVSCDLTAYYIWDVFSNRFQHDSELTEAQLDFENTNTETATHRR